MLSLLLLLLLLLLPLLLAGRDGAGGRDVLSLSFGMAVALHIRPVSVYYISICGIENNGRCMPGCECDDVSEPHVPLGVSKPVRREFNTCLSHTPCTSTQGTYTQPHSRGPS
jgi:hypothetical protein